MPRLQIVVDYILEQIRKRNVDEIEVNVYRRGTPSEYNRTRQFQQAWKADKSTIRGNTASGKFHYDPDSMEYDADEAQHALPTRHGEMLVNILPSLSTMAHLAQSTEMAIGRNVVMHGKA